MGREVGALFRARGSGPRVGSPSAGRVATTQQTFHLNQPIPYFNLWCNWPENTDFCVLAPRAASRYCAMSTYPLCGWENTHWLIMWHRAVVGAPSNVRSALLYACRPSGRSRAVCYIKVLHTKLKRSLSRINHMVELEHRKFEWKLNYEKEMIIGL